MDTFHKNGKILEQIFVFHTLKKGSASVLSMSSKNKEIAIKKDFKFQFSVEDLNKEVQFRYFSTFGQV